MGAIKVETQIDNYLSLLTSSQKLTILNVVKTIAMAGEEYDNIWKNEVFKNEMESRTASYEKGTARLLKFEEMKKKAISANKKAGA